MITVKLDTRKAHALLTRAGVKLCRDSAERGRDVARSRARVDERDMKNGILAVPTRDGANLEGRDWKTIWHEYGTGRFAGAADAQYPGQRGSTGSRAKEIPWVYMDEGGNFYMTEGVPPQPMIRPGFSAGCSYFRQEAKRRGM